jgi:hypothetical protein
MSEAAVTGRGPVSLVTSSGIQVSIPLTALYFDANGALQAGRWPLYNKFKTDVDPWLSYLVKNGELTPAASPPPVAAMVITAADPGPAGNNIQVTFSNITPDAVDPSDPTKTKFDALVAETDSYTGLSYDSGAANFINNVLGTAQVIGTVTAAGTQPGLVRVLDGDQPTQPNAGDVQLTGGTAMANSTVAVPGPAGDAFHLVAKKLGGDGDETKVTIANVDAVAKTFSLTATWSATIPGITLADLPAKLAQNGYEISVTDPSGGNAFTTVPAAGAVKLTGGAGAQPASAARATVYSA